MEERWKAIKAVEKSLNHQFETTNTLVRLGNKVGQRFPSIATNLPTLDFKVLSCGGIPRGRIIEVFGPESSGKTTICLHIIAEEQKAGGLAAFVDAEHALDPAYAAKLGVDVDNLLVCQPDYGEMALETVEALIDSRAVTLIVIDSVAALVPKAELDGEMGDSHMGLHARLMSQAMRKLTAKSSKANIPVIFINQIREKVGVIYGSPEVTTGGRALKFYSSVRLDVRRVGGEDGTIKSGGVQIGHVVKVKAVKSKVGTPFRDTKLDLIYGAGFDKESDMVEYGVSVGAIQQAGTWFELPGFDRVQGKGKLKAILKETPEAVTALKHEIDKAVKAQIEAEKS